MEQGPPRGTGAQAAPELVAKGQKPQQGTAQSCWERRWEALSEENNSPTASASSPALRDSYHSSSQPLRRGKLPITGHKPQRAD